MLAVHLMQVNERQVQTNNMWQVYFPLHMNKGKKYSVYYNASI